MVLIYTLMQLNMRSWQLGGLGPKYEMRCESVGARRPPGSLCFGASYTDLANFISSRFLHKGMIAPEAVCQNSLLFHFVLSGALSRFSRAQMLPRRTTLHYSNDADIGSTKLYHNVPKRLSYRQAMTF